MHMSITKIEITNSKSLRKVSIPLVELNCLVGENGSGKSNVLRNVEYFYLNLTDKHIHPELKDKHNPYNDLEITVTYDFTRIYKIARSHEDGHQIYGWEYNNFFKKIISLYIEFAAGNNGFIRATLKLNRKNELEWNIPYELRSFLKNIFPMYVVNARHINLTNWEQLWSIIGDLGKLENNQRKKLDEELQGFFSENFGEKYDYIKSEFSNQDIEFKKFTPKTKFSHLYQLYIGGQIFRHRYEDLSYFSDGINSYNFIRLLTQLVKKSSLLRIKEPLIVLDEPEVGLHPKYIDHLMTSITKEESNTNFLLCTHSSRLIKSIMNEEMDCNIFHIIMNGKYSELTKMNPFSDKRESIAITEKEASYYFSRVIVFVEGQTEIELFSNKFLLELFPFLRDVDFYSFDGDSVKINIVHPRQKNTSIPYLLVTDMDKLLQYDLDKQCFTLKRSEKFINPLTDREIHKKEVFFYGQRRYDTLQQRKRVDGFLNNCKFFSDEYWGYINSSYYDELKSVLTKYCLQYNVFPVSTTVEGLLVNRASYELIYEWFNQTYSDKSHSLNKIYNYRTDWMFRTSALRLIHSGKYDNLLTRRQRFNNNPIVDFDGNNVPEVQEIYDKIDKIKQGKTSGWVTSFLNYFFEHKCTAETKMQKFIEYFPELYLLVLEIGKIIRR